MTYTSHGHHIPGTTDALDEGGELPKKHRCGGVRICGQCKTEALAELPEDSIAAADIRNDLEALAIIPQESRSIPIEIFRPNYYSFPAMQFTGDLESFADLKLWLASHGHQAAFWENVYDHSTNSRINTVEFRKPGDVAHNTKVLYPGDWLVLWVSPWDRNERPRPAEFKAYSQENFEEQFERATLLVPVPWHAEVSGHLNSPDVQPELGAINKLKKSRAPQLESLF